MLENIRFFCRSTSMRSSYLSNTNYMLEDKEHNLFTTSPHKLWKTIKTPLLLKVFLIFLCVVFLFSCSSSKKAKKSHPALDNAVISMTGDEVKKRLGEPDIVSRTPENKIIWTYLPSWKIMPDNKDTIYVEFDDGKVVKVIKGK